MLSDILHSIQAKRDHEPTVISLGQVWVDSMIKVPEFPAPGSFMNAESIARSVNGSFAVLEAASRMGAQTELAGILGTGPWSDMIRRALKRVNVRHTGITNKGLDNGLRLVINDGPGTLVHLCSRRGGAHRRAHVRRHAPQVRRRRAHQRRIVDEHGRGGGGIVHLTA